MSSKAEKAAYDRIYRERNKDRLRKEHAAYFQRTYDPVQAAVDRKAKMPLHLEYFRRPEYRAYKNKYDRRKELEEYGEFGEAWLLLKELRKEIYRQEPDRMKRYQQSGRKQWNPLLWEQRRINRAKESERRQGRSERSEGVDSPKPQERIVEHPQRSAPAQGASRKR